MYFCLKSIIHQYKALNKASLQKRIVTNRKAQYDTYDDSYNHDGINYYRDDDDK